MTSNPQIQTTTSVSIGPSFEQLVMPNITNLETPVARDYLLSVGVKVRRSSDSYAAEFMKTIREGLMQAYLEGKDRQLGIQEHRDSMQQVIRMRRKTDSENMTAGNSSGTTTVPSLIHHTISALVPGLYQTKRQGAVDVKVSRFDTAELGGSQKHNCHLGITKVTLCDKFVEISYT